MNKFLSLKDFDFSACEDVSKRANDFQAYIDQMASFDTKPYWVISDAHVGALMNVDFSKEPVSAFIANDYLGMSQNEETVEAGIHALCKYGTGSCAAQAIGGYLDIHKKFEHDIAEFVGQEDALIFSSGFGSNAGLFRALLGKNDIAYIDSFIHTSAHAGLIGTNTKNIGHNEVEYLDMILEKNKGKYITSVCTIDGVYSQDGDLSRLPEYIEVCKKHGCLLVMDDAHGVGVMGCTGRGTAEYYDCIGKVDIITGTFSKSFGCVGGFVAASERMVQYLRYYADSSLFSAAITPQATSSVLKALELIKTRPDIRQKLWDNVNYLRTRLTENNFDIGHSVSPIFPIMVRDNEKVYKIADLLQKNRIFASGIVYPAVRGKEARIRMSLLATHEKWQLDHLVDTLIKIRSQIDF